VSQQQRIALGVYVGLLLLCVVLIVGAEFLGPTVRASLLPIAVEGFKMVLAALVGAISALLGIRDAKPS
jgi:hypothetical protein